MTEILENILECLTEEEKKKEIIIKEKDHAIGRLFENDIILYEQGNTKKIYLGGLGALVDFTSKTNLVYRNSRNEIVIKPKEIIIFLKNEAKNWL